MKKVRVFGKKKIAAKKMRSVWKKWELFEKPMEGAWKKQEKCLKT